MIWKPNVTVASVIEHEGRYLMVEEESSKGPMLNQPAGHLEPNESLLDAVIRETLEETGYRFTPDRVVGSYLWHNDENQTTYYRATYAGEVCHQTVLDDLDDGIIRTLWLTKDDIVAEQDRLRSPVILESINDYEAGHCYPLSLIKSFIK